MTADQDENDLVEFDAVHGYFGLTYANHLVLERTLLQSMPDDWQNKFVALLDQMEAAFSGVPRASGWLVLPIDEVAVYEAMWEFRDSADVWASDEEEDAAYVRIALANRTGDPVPYYDRGRARVTPT